VKIAAPGRSVLTTQLYLPGEPQNADDWLFREELLVALDRSGETPVAAFEFVLPTA
jgi:protocatechuate 3,4-dioxygenase beta subunit